MVGYRLTLIQSSNLYFSLICVILLELNHCCAYMQCLYCYGKKIILSLLWKYNIVIQWVTDDHKLKRFFMLSGHISNISLLHYKPTWLWNLKRFSLKVVSYRSVNLFTTALVTSVFFFSLHSRFLFAFEGNHILFSFTIYSLYSWYKNIEHFKRFSCEYERSI